MPANPPDSPLALVTGGSRGIGRAITARLARDGFDVAVAAMVFRDEVMQLFRMEDGSGVGGPSFPGQWAAVPSG